MERFVSWFERAYKGIIIGLVAVMAVTMVVLAIQHVDESKPAAGAEPGPIPTFAGTRERDRKQPDAALSLLNESDRPFVISVIGDSTGAIEGNWVGQLAAWMSERYDRPVEMHQWSVREDPNLYQDAITIGEGAEAPIIIWNGSAEGKNIDYSLENWDRLVPDAVGPVDLAFINHGHNVAAGQLAAAGNSLLKVMKASMPSAAIVIVGQNPQNDSGGTLGPDQATNVRAWMADARKQGYAVVDVLDVFLRQGDYSKLLVGAVHPTPDGFTLWAEAVEKTIAP